MISTTKIFKEAGFKEGDVIEIVVSDGKVEITKVGQIMLNGGSDEGSE